MPLGRGLGSLIPPKNTFKTAKPITPAALAVESDEMTDTRERVLRLGVDKIKPNSHQPRRDFAPGALADLAESIKEHGVLQPLVVIKQDGEYELIAGERRLRAAKLAGLKEVPAIVREADLQRKLELALVENIQRENLNPIDVAESIKKLIDEFGLKQEEAARRLGKSRSSVANYLRLLTLPDEIKRALTDGRLSEGHAKVLLSLESEAKQIAMYQKILANKLSVAETSTVIKRSGGGKQSKQKPDYADQDRENRLRERLGAKVTIKRNPKGGQIGISFFSDDELNDLMEKIGQ